MSRNRLYIFLLTACIAGYSWLAYSYFRSDPLHADTGVCFFRHFTGIPCPSCGSTRAVLSFLHGDLMNSLAWNPFGIVLILIMSVLPLWIIYDVVSQESSLHRFYNHAELFLNRKPVAIPLIIIVLINWAWNVLKGL